MNGSIKPVEQMTFRELVETMMKCQKEYFDKRTDTALKNAKWWESKVREWLRDHPKDEDTFQKQVDLW